MKLTRIRLFLHWVALFVFPVWFQLLPSSSIFPKCFSALSLCSFPLQLHSFAFSPAFASWSAMLTNFYALLVCWHTLRHILSVLFLVFVSLYFFADNGEITKLLKRWVLKEKFGWIERSIVRKATRYNQWRESKIVTKHICWVVQREETTWNRKIKTNFAK